MENNVMVTNLFWTSGWDSTFRLLQLLIVEKKKVQPIYLVRSEQSVGQEVNAMMRIRKEFFAKYPHLKESFLPIMFFDELEIKIDEDILNRYQILSEKYQVNQQYLLLAQLCRNANLRNVEIGFEGPITENTAPINDNNCIIFKNYKTNIIDLTKKNIERISIENQWMNIMKHTVSCRRPSETVACGLCGPCQIAYYEGLGWRLPLKARILSFILVPFRIRHRKNYRNKDKFTYKIIDKLFRNRF